MNDTSNPDQGRHGTHAGYARHQRQDERPCDACVRAKREYDQRRKAAPREVLKSRLAARAQQRAYGRLARLYPDAYRVLYAEEKAAAFAELPADGDA